MEDEPVLAFASRIGPFYARLERTRLDALSTFEDVELRRFFADERDFMDYYASLAAQVRAAHFRRSQPLEVEIREFHFPQGGQALVDVRLSGRHERALRFWSIEILRTDTWERVDGTWFLSPGKL